MDRKINKQLFSIYPPVWPSTMGSKYVWSRIRFLLLWVMWFYLIVILSSTIWKQTKCFVKWQEFIKNKCDFKNIWPHCITFWYHIDKKVQFLKMTSFKSSFPVFYLHFTAKKNYLRYWFLSLWENCLQSCFNLLLICTLRGAGPCRGVNIWRKCENFRKCYLAIHPKMNEWLFFFSLFNWILMIFY